MNRLFSIVNNNILNDVFRVLFLLAICRYYFIANMDYEASILRLNEYCILELLRIMNIASILAFGCTNRRYRAIVYDFIIARQQQRNIHFVLDNPVSIMREIILRFGMHFIILDVQFRREYIGMNIFQDEIEGCNINNCRELNLFAFVNEAENRYYEKNDDDDYDFDPMDYDYPYGDYFDPAVSIPPMLDRFRINVENIIMSINNSDIPRLRCIRFNFDLFLTPHSYNMDEWFVLLNSIVRNLFIGLRNGNMTFSHTNDYLTYNVR